MTTLTDVGDRLEGNKIIGEGRKITPYISIAKSGRHRAYRVSIYGKPAQCIIDKSCRWIGD